GLVVVEAQQGVDDPQVKAAIEKFLADVEATVQGTSTASFYAEGAERQIAADRKIAYAEINFSDRSGEKYLDAGKQVKKLQKDVHVPGMRVELGGGDMFADQNMPPSELLGVAGAMLILLIAFGSVLAMGLPVLTALFGIGIGVS